MYVHVIPTLCTIIADVIIALYTYFLHYLWEIKYFFSFLVFSDIARLHCVLCELCSDQTVFLSVCEIPAVVCRR